MLVALVLLAAGCATPAPGARASEANREQCDSVPEREYKPALRNAGIEGVPKVWLLVDKEGIVRDSGIGESSGDAELDDIALRIARCRRFAPALHKGVPVPVRLLLPIPVNRPRPGEPDGGDSS
ncbi:MAG: energy transducer TonB [Gemmatimonadota bacterium]|nr:energy transducer TonB [Gemmatimonadota bacterium]